jgi:hypothetical protein
MKFKSNRDSYFKLTILFLILFTSAISVWYASGIEPSGYWKFIPLLFLGYLGFHRYFRTSYELNKTHLICKRLFNKESIPLDRIHSIEYKDNYFFGSHPATAKTGLLISYQTTMHIYITPEQQDLFVERLLELNDEIVVKESKLSHA